MQYDRSQDWRRIVAVVDPELADRINALTGHVIGHENQIPRKYKELILMCCAATLRYGSSVRMHGKEALYQGASSAEIVEALSLASLSGGLTVMIEAMEALGDQLQSDGAK